MEMVGACSNATMVYRILFSMPCGHSICQHSMEESRCSPFGDFRVTVSVYELVLFTRRKI